MAEYIDREKLINDSIAKGFCDWYDEIKYAQKADVVEQEKIDKAIDEAYKMRNEVLYANSCYEPDDVLDIIDQITKLFEEI